MLNNILSRSNYTTKEQSNLLCYQIRYTIIVFFTLWLYKQTREFLATTRLKSYVYKMGEGDEENSSDVYDIGVVSAAPAYERQPQLMERGLYKPEARYDGVQLLDNSY